VNNKSNNKYYLCLQFTIKIHKNVIILINVIKQRRRRRRSMQQTHETHARVRYYLLNCQAQCSSLNAYDSACNLHVASRHVMKHFTIELLTRCYITLFRHMDKTVFFTTFGNTSLSKICVEYKLRLF